MSQLLSALKEAHKARIIHRDVKPENIMVERPNEKDFSIKLADWGSSRKINTVNNLNLTVEVIPIAYRPPELFFESKRYS
jgi:serine/threonine protein kinase